MRDFSGPRISKLDCALLLSSFALGVAIVLGTYHSKSGSSDAFMHSASMLGKAGSLSLAAQSLLDSD